MFAKRDLLGSVAVTAVAVAKSSSATAQSKADWPRLLEAKDIAQQRFMLGLPIVMNYANEYAVDRNSGQFKAPFNQIKNEPTVYGYKDTAIVTPNSDPPFPSRG